MTEQTSQTKQAEELLHLSALKDLHDLLKTTDKVTLIRFASERNLHRYFRLALVNEGIIRNTNGGRGQSATFVWNTTYPNLDMVRMLLFDGKEEIEDLEEEVGINSGEREESVQKTKSTITRRTKRISHTKTRLLFGLIKIRTDYFYEF